MIPIDLFADGFGGCLSLIFAGELHKQVLTLNCEFGQEGVQNIMLSVRKGVFKRRTEYNFLTCHQVEFITEAVCSFRNLMHSSGLESGLPHPEETVTNDAYRLCLSCNLTNGGTEENICHRPHTFRSG